MTGLGGAYGDGTVFELKPGSHAIDLLGTFDGTNGAAPSSALTLDSQGDLFGTAEGGGPDGRGTVFEIVRGSHAITTICAFDSSTGSMPNGRLAVDSNGDLFGTTIGGGANNAGTVFEIASGSRTITTLASFSGTNGSSPNGAFLDHRGNLFGTTLNGGANGDGVVFEVAHGINRLVTIASFNGHNGSSPDGGLVADASGNLFGTTSNGGKKNDGTVFEITRGRRRLKTLASFNLSTGANPQGELAVDRDGSLFGTTSTSSDGTGGTVFRVDPVTDKIDVIAHVPDMMGTYAGVTLGPDGKIYGTYNDEGLGGLFSLSRPFPKFKVLFRFPILDLSGPINSDPQGDIFAGAAGGIVEIPSGSHSFMTIAPAHWAGSNADVSPLVLDAAGNIYGTYSQYPSTRKSIFELPRGSHHIQTLDSVNFGLAAGVIVDPAGDVFGASTQGGRYGKGFIFEIPARGRKFTTLASWTDSQLSPGGSLSIDSKGNLYGIAAGNGTYTGIFELPHGAKTVIYPAPYLHPTEGSNIAIDRNDNLFVIDLRDQPALYEFPDGSTTPTLLTTYELAAHNPDDLIVDPQGNLFGASPFGIVEFAPGSFDITTLATFPYIIDNAVGDSNGNLYFLRFDGSEMIYKIAT
jgi:uncharacterized repeat protein (TIGR03803 family)